MVAAIGLVQVGVISDYLTFGGVEGQFGVAVALVELGFEEGTEADGCFYCAGHFIMQ